jgi:hypothetical protein
MATMHPAKINNQYTYHGEDVIPVSFFEHPYKPGMKMATVYGNGNLFVVCRDDLEDKIPAQVTCFLSQILATKNMPSRMLLASLKNHSFNDQVVMVRNFFQADQQVPRPTAETWAVMVVSQLEKVDI